MDGADVDLKYYGAVVFAVISGAVLAVSVALRAWTPPRVISRTFASEASYVAFKTRGGRERKEPFGCVIDATSGAISSPEVSSLSLSQRTMKKSG